MATSDEKIQAAAMREVFLRMANREVSLPVFQLCEEMHAIVARCCSNPDPFKAEREWINAEALSMLTALERKRDESSDPFTTVVLFSAAANTLACAHGGRSSGSSLRRAWRYAMRSTLEHDGSQSLADRLIDAKRIVFIADNSGEIVWDRLFIEMLPAERLTIVVKRRPYLIDAMRGDLIIAGISGKIPVIEYSHPIPGDQHPVSEEHLRDALLNADLIISKGPENMAYLDTQGYGAKSFCLLVPECGYLASRINVGQGVPVADFLPKLLSLPPRKDEDGS